MNTDSTQRFSDRVESYARARPDYPVAVLDAIEQLTEIPLPWAVADIGSGTGIFTRMLLNRGHTVFAVEPNAPMRAAAEAALSEHARFRSVAGRAEATVLADASLDLVTAAQAFHWFDAARARREWIRILRWPLWAALLWNDRIPGRRFNEAYEAFLLEWGGEEYVRVRRSWRVESSLSSLFGEAGWTQRSFPNAQVMDAAGLEGRLLSSSYLPGPAHPRRAAMLERARRLFDTHQVEGVVTLQYETRLYVGRL